MRGLKCLQLFGSIGKTDLMLQCYSLFFILWAIDKSGTQGYLKADVSVLLVDSDRCDYFRQRFSTLIENVKAQEEQHVSEEEEEGRYQHQC